MDNSDSVLIISLATIGSALIGLIIRYSFRSKCNDVSMLWGCCHIIRDTEQEIEEEKINPDQSFQKV